MSGGRSDGQACLVPQANDFSSSPRNGLDRRVDSDVNTPAVEHPAAVGPDVWRPGERHRDHGPSHLDRRVKRTQLEGEQL